MKITNNSMIKVFAYITLMPCLSFSVAAKEADKSSWYLVSSLGYVSGDTNSNEIVNDFAKSGITVTDVKIDDSRYGWQLSLGYEISNNFALELGYLDLDKVSVELTGTVTDETLFIDQARINHPESAKGVTFNAGYRFDLNDNLALNAKLGLFSWKGEFDTYKLDSGQTLANHNINGTDVFYGLNAEYKLTNQFSLQLQWQKFKLENEKPDMWSIALKYRF